MDVEEWLVGWFEKNTDLGKSEIKSGLSENYLDKGWIDSLKFINLVSDIEGHFGIRFSNEQFQDREFSTIKGLASIIGARLKKK